MLVIRQRLGTSGCSVSRLVPIVTALCYGCDTAFTLPTCEVVDQHTYTDSATLADEQRQGAAQFEFEQVVTTYASGECEIPTNLDGVYLVVRNITSCTLDITFTVTLIEGREGWTIQETAHVERGASEEIGIIQGAAGPRVDRAQMMVAGSVEKSDCQ